MIITIYELLGLIKDGKAPKRIKVTGNVYDFDEEYDFYFTKTKNGRVALGGMLNEINLLFNFLNENNVEILEEENKIEKLKWNEKSQHNVVTDNTKKTLEHLLSRTEQLKKSLNELIDEINKLKEKK